MIFAYCIGGLFFCGLFFLGKWMRQHPDAGSRIMFWAPRIAATYFRVVGTFFAVGGTLGVIFYTVLIIIRLI